MDTMIAKVCKQIEKVLVLIVEGKDKNDLVKTIRGKKFADLDLPSDFSTVNILPALADEPHTAPELYEHDTI